ncbi:MAG: methyltransferase domain-containing protein [Methylocella sp.]
MRDLSGLPAAAFGKYDTAPDELFYAEPRFVTHIDAGAIAAVTALYRELFPLEGVILDLMSSWVSHLPGDVPYREVIGHGMNERELAANPRLSRFFLQNLNIDPMLLLETSSVDAAAICVSVQYLQKPVGVLRELARVLKPGSPVAITFSNLCFPTKSVMIWQAVPDADHQWLVRFYLEQAGFGSIEARTLCPPGHSTDPLWAVIGRVPNSKGACA